MYCKNCGTKITDDINFCPNCGVPLGSTSRGENKEKPFWRYGWFTVLMLFVCFPVGLILIFMNHGKVAKGITGVFLALLTYTVLSAVFTTTGDYLSINDIKHYVGINTSEDNGMINDTQLEFSKRLKEFKTEYDKARSDLQKSEVANQQAQYLRDFFNKNEINGWRGEIFSIEPVEGGKFARVHLKCKISGMSYDVITERYHSILSNNETLVVNGSELYNKLKTLKNYEDVVFSAKVIKDKNRFYNRDRLFGAIDVWSPEIVVQFIDIKKVDG